LRIVSLLPSATEICFALGLGDELVGVTHECDYPPAALEKPRVTSSRTHEGLSSREIDQIVRSQLVDAGTIYSLDLEKLEELKPDLILTQRLCTVCAVSIDTVREVASQLSSKPRVENLEPRTMSEVFATFRRVAQMCGKLDEAAKTISALEQRYRHVGRVTKGLDSPRVLVLEWIDPPFASGHWIPELVEAAGGRNTVAFKHRPSREISWSQVMEAKADIIVVAACGFGIERQKQEIEIILGQLGLNGLARETMGAPDLWICDGSQYFSRPGPRLVDTAEMLAFMMHPELSEEFGSKFKVGSDLEFIDYGTTAQYANEYPWRWAAK